MFIWPIPHTIAIRNSLLGVVLLLLSWEAWNQRAIPLAGLPKTALASFVLLTIWILLHTMLLADDQTYALGEFKGQWLKSTLAFLLGILAGMTLANRTIVGAKALLVAVVAPLVMHVLLLNLMALGDTVFNGHLPDRFPGLTEGPDKASYLTNMTLGFLLAAGVLRLTGHRLGTWRLDAGLGMLFLAVLAATYLERMRNGTVAMLLLMCFAGVVVLLHTGKLSYRRQIGFASLLVALLVVIVALTARDPRWAKFEEMAKFAWQDRSRTWLNPSTYTRLHLPSGEPVDPSTYLRVSWLREGLRIVIERPAGVGFGRNAFARALREKYGEGRGHTHSGALDLTIGVGIPGLLLWATVLGGIWVWAWRQYRQREEFAALALLFITTDFAARMLVDSVMRDHMLEQFLFVAGVLISMSSRESHGDES